MHRRVDYYIYDSGIFRLSLSHAQCTVRSCCRFSDLDSNGFYVPLSRGGIAMGILACVMELGVGLWFAYKGWKDWQ